MNHLTELVSCWSEVKARALGEPRTNQSRLVSSVVIAGSAFHLSRTHREQRLCAVQHDRENRFCPSPVSRRS
jgi:hypothetical protein